MSHNNCLYHVGWLDTVIKELPEDFFLYKNIQAELISVSFRKVKVAPYDYMFALAVCLELFHRLTLVQTLDPDNAMDLPSKRASGERLWSSSLILSLFFSRQPRQGPMIEECKSRKLRVKMLEKCHELKLKIPYSTVERVHDQPSRRTAKPVIKNTDCAYKT